MNDVLSDEALEDLERKRQAATPGRWSIGDVDQIQTEDGEIVLPPVEGDEDNGDVIATANKQWVAAANPEAVGRLIAEVRRARLPLVLTVKSAGTVEEQQAVAERLRQLKSTTDWRGLMLGPAEDSRAETLEKAAQSFERMVAEGDGEPLSLGAVARMLREQAGNRQGRGGTLSPKEEQEVRIHHAGGRSWATAKEFADGTRLLQREDGTLILPPEGEWPTFFERIWEDEHGTMGLKGGVTFILKPKEKP